MADAGRSRSNHSYSSGGEGEGRKRRRDWGSDDGEGPKRQGRPPDVVFRVVVPSRQIGRVIGKEGSQIQSIRVDTRATIKIADAVSVG